MAFAVLKPSQTARRGERDAVSALPILVRCRALAHHRDGEGRVASPSRLALALSANSYSAFCRWPRLGRMYAGQAPCSQIKTSGFRQVNS